jgi:hypothetical protein
MFTALVAHHESAHLDTQAVPAQPPCQVTYTKMCLLLTCSRAIHLDVSGCG